MKKIILAFLVALAPSCAIFQNPEGLHLEQIAEEVELYRQDLLTLAPLASPELQETLVELDRRMLEIEKALQAASHGGPVHDITSAAQAALDLAAVIAAALPAENDLRFAIAVAQIALRHLAAAEFSEIQ